MKKLLIIVYILCNILKNTEAVQCRGEDGQYLDWYYLYKLPLHFLTKENLQNDTHGLRYIYITSKSYTQEWKLSNISINNIKSLPGQTLNPILLNLTTLLLAYNDETPSGEVNIDDGHTKGVIAADLNSGFWLIHSVPKFPNTQIYDYPKTALHYGQSFLCISINSSQIELIGKQLIFNEPNFYTIRIPDSLKELYPTLVRASNKDWKKEAPFWNELEIRTINNTSFRSFAKGRKFQKELYEDWIAPALNSNLLVETWRHGPGNLPTNCTRKNRVFNIGDIKIDEINFNFTSTSDHSKWAVADYKSNDWICVGDINRAEHQLKRGGGTVCHLNSDVTNSYRNIISKVEPCP